MTAVKTKRRAWFQLHLSTCVVLMVETSALIGLNLAENKGTGDEWADSWYGWPAVSYSREGAFNFLGFSEFTGDPRDDKIVYLHRWSWPGMVTNFAVAFLILALSARTCEYLIRRRERKRAEKAAA